MVASTSCKTYFNVVPGPCFLPEEQSRYAGSNAAKQEVENTTLPQVLCCLIGDAGVAAQATAAWGDHLYSFRYFGDITYIFPCHQNNQTFLVSNQKPWLVFII